MSFQSSQSLHNIFPPNETSLELLHGDLGWDWFKCSLLLQVISFDNLFSLRIVCFNAQMGVWVDVCIDGFVNG